MNLVEEYPVVLVHAPAHRVENRFRLLVDLFQHEVLVAALLRGLKIPVDVDGFGFKLFSVEIEEAHRPGFHLGDLTILQRDHVARVSQQRRDVGSDETGCRSCPNDDRRFLARRDDDVRLESRDAHEREGTFEDVDRFANRVQQRTLFARDDGLDQVSGHLGIGIGTEGVTFSF